MKLAYFSPVSPQKSGISDYSEVELLPYLSRYFNETNIFIDKNVKPSNPYLINNFDIFPYNQFDKMHDKYDVVLYHIGNNGLHEYIYNTLIKYPGIVVLHDVYLHGLLWNMSIAKRAKKRYFDEFRYCYGEKGLGTAKKAVETGVYPEFEYPLLKRILDNSKGIITHSNFGVSKVLSEKVDIIIKKINHPLTISKEILDLDKKVKVIKEEYDCGETIVIASFGYINAHKRYPILFKAFKSFIEEGYDAKLFLVGQDLMGVDRLISEYNLKGYITLTGYVPFEKIVDYLAMSDFCVNLRYPTAGETSGSVLGILAAGKPVIVSNIGWFSELPNNTCLKVDVDSYEKEVLLECMKLLARDKNLRETIGSNAREYVIKEHNPEKIAREYYKFIKGIVEGDEYIIKEISDGLFDLGVEEGDEEIIKEVAVSLLDILKKCGRKSVWSTHIRNRLLRRFI